MLICSDGTQWWCTQRGAAVHGAQQVLHGPRPAHAVEDVVSLHHRQRCLKRVPDSGRHTGNRFKVYDMTGEKRMYSEETKWCCYACPEACDLGPVVTIRDAWALHH
jgi:hypothetical protein